MYEMVSGEPRRWKPNILITGSTGTGKSLTCGMVCSQTGLAQVDVGMFAKENNLFTGWDDQYQCHMLDDDKVIDDLEETIQRGGVVLEYHSCDFFPKRWFDAVFVLRTNNTILYDRLQQRGYSGKKLLDNIQCEIFQTTLEEARDSYDHDIVHELYSDSPEHLEHNTDIIVKFITDWCAS